MAPVIIPSHLPAAKALAEENIFTISRKRANTQDIRPLEVALLNLMPNKKETETQLIRLLSNTMLQVRVTLLHMQSHVAKNTAASYLEDFYQSFDTIAHRKFDALIITGAPVEQMEFADVFYWQELCSIFDWAERNVFTQLYICWGAQAALHYHYGLEKELLPKKLSGVYLHNIHDGHDPLLRGFDDQFYAPHSRYTDVPLEQIKQQKDLVLLASSNDAGAHIIRSKNRRKLFIMGHPEYDRLSLHQEYIRDVEKGIDPDIPANYYENNDPAAMVHSLWRSSAHLLYANWINYDVYQETPYNIAT